MCGTCVKLRKKHVCNLCTHKKNMCVTCVRYLKIDTEKITCVYVLYVCCAVLDSTLNTSEKHHFLASCVRKNWLKTRHNLVKNKCSTQFQELICFNLSFWQLNNFQRSRMTKCTFHCSEIIKFCYKNDFWAIFWPK